MNVFFVEVPVFLLSLIIYSPLKTRSIMKLLFTLLLLAGGLTTFAQNKIDGNWKGTRETPNGTFEINYTFKVEGNELKGTWKTQFGETKIENGKIDGKKFSFSVSFNDRKIDYTGEVISDDELTVKNERGETKLTRVKS
jgi:hypothetical protein